MNYFLKCNDINSIHILKSQDSDWWSQDSSWHVQW